MESQQKPLFLVFVHRPFIIGEKYNDDDEKLRDRIVYTYPERNEEGFCDKLVSSVVSLYTMVSHMEGSNELDLISFFDWKIGICTFVRDDGNVLFFMLRYNAKVPDGILKNNISCIFRGIFFVLGKNGMNDVSYLVFYLRFEANRLFSEILPINNDKIMDFSFPNIQSCETSCHSLTTLMVEQILLKKDSRIWGVSCFMNNMILASQTPMDIVQKFLFVPSDAPQSIVYLTKEERDCIMNQKGCLCYIPEKEINEATLLRFENSNVVFFILTDKVVSEDLYSYLLELIPRTMEQMYINKSKPVINYPPDTAMYDKTMLIFREGEMGMASREHALSIHNKFVNNNRITDIIMKDPQTLTYAINTYGVENYSSCSSAIDLSTEQQCSYCIRQSPQIFRFISALQ